MSAQQSDSGDSELQETTVIEQATEPRSFKQQQILDAIKEYGHVREDGTLDIDRAMEHVDTQKQHVFETFGRYGRLAHYTTATDEPYVEVVGKPTGRGADVSAAVLSLIADYATINDDGTVNGRPVADHEGPDGQTYSATTIYRNVGRHCRVLLPWADRPRQQASSESDPDGIADRLLNDDSGPFENAILNEIVSEDEVPSNPILALEYGFELARSIEKMKVNPKQ